MLSMTDSPQNERFTQAESEGMGKMFHANGDQKKKKAGGAILLCDKLYFKTKTVTRDKDGHHLILKGSVHQEVITLVYMHPYRSTQTYKENLGGL